MTLIHKKADEIASFIKAAFLDQNGVFYSQLDAATRGLVTHETTKGGVPHEWFDGFDLPGFWLYENAGMTTGSYLAALCISGTPEERKRAYQGIKWLYEQGKNQEEGFIPKPYGGKFYPQTSTDQVLYVMYALDAYYPLADEAEQNTIRRMIVKMAEFWMKRNYIFDYYYVKDMKWPPLRFPPLLLTAWRYSGDERFRKEAYRILDENIEWLPEHSKVFVRKGLSDFEKEHDVRIINQAADAVSMDIMNLDLMLRCDPNEPYRKRFVDAMKISWKEGLLTLLEDGHYEGLLFYDMKTGEVRRPRQDENPINGVWQPYSSAWSTMIVRAGLIACKYLPEQREEIVTAAKHVLKKIGLENCSYKERGENFKEEQLYQYRFLSGDGIANWLWAANLLLKLENQK